MYFLKLFFFCFFLLSGRSLVAQLEIGSHPSDIDWMQINNPRVKVIYPRGQDQQARRIADLIDYMADEHLASIGLRTRKIDLVLQTNQVLSNGYAALSPYRTEFFATPFQSNQILGSINWLDALTIHEYRHALQYTNANRGITRFFHILQGQNGWAVAMNLSLPDWFFEGDATMTETVLSAGGRGRTPAFFKEQRALFASKRHYSYMKARNGSFKDLVPDHYRLGYAMMNYGRNQFDPNIWADVVADAGRYRSLFYPFSSALKRHTGLRAPAMYRAAYDALEQGWEKELNGTPFTELQKLDAGPKKVVTDQRWPNILDDGSVVYLESSYRKTPAIYRLKDGRSAQVTTQGISAQTFLSERNGKLAWTELRSDPRWANRNYSVVMTYDLQTGSKEELTKKSKYFSPEFSHKGQDIATVEVDQNLKVRIHIIDAGSGAVKRILKNENEDFISYPKWTTDDRSIVYLAKRNSALAFLQYDLNTDQIIQLTEWTTSAIGAFNVNDHSLVYSAGHTGIDNIFVVDLDQPGTIQQVSSVAVGAYDPDISADGSRIVFTEFAAMGHQLRMLSAEHFLNEPISLQAPEDQAVYNVRRSDTEYNILERVPQNSYEPKSYQSLFRGMKLHSWGFGGNMNATALSLQFQNILNDVQAEAFTAYNTNENALSVGGRLDIARWFTILNLSTVANSRSAYRLTPVDTLSLESFTERNLSAGLSLPLRWIHGNYATRLNMSTAYVHRLTSAYEQQEKREESIGSIRANFSLSNIRRRALQNVLPRFGQILQLSYLRSVTGISGEKFSASASLFLPGIFQNHSIRIDGAYQKENLRNVYQFPDGFFYARGYAYPSFNDQALRLGVNYQLPLIYPDWGFWGLIYFKRLRANLFYDVAEVKIEDLNFNRTQASLGGELLIDNTYFNVLPITLGVRYAYLLDALPGRQDYDISFFFIADF